MKQSWPGPASPYFQAPLQCPGCGRDCKDTAATNKKEIGTPCNCFFLCTWGNRVWRVCSWLSPPQPQTPSDVNTELIAKIRSQIKWHKTCPLCPKSATKVIKKKRTNIGVRWSCFLLKALTRYWGPKLSGLPSPDKKPPPWIHTF